MAKHQHQQQQPLPRPTAPLTPSRQSTPDLLRELEATKPPSLLATERPAAPILTSVALGKTASGLHAVALLRTQGLTLVSCSLLCPPTADAASAEEEWRNASYPTLYHGKPPATQEGRIVSGSGLAMDRSGTGYRVTLVELDEGRVLPFRERCPTAPTHEERLGSFVYTGNKLDAWQELDLYAAKYLLRESLAYRRRKAAGG